MSQNLQDGQDGCTVFTLCLAPDLVTFAQTQWRAQGFVDIEAYLGCVLNTALFHESEADPPPPVVAAFDEQDDDIPFDPPTLPTKPRVRKPSSR